LSTENLQETQENQEEEVRQNSPDEEFDRIVATFTIPENIDPILLEAWLRREKKAFLEKQHLETGTPVQARSPSLPLTYATYLSVVMMSVVILLGLLNGTDPSLILPKAFLVMILFFGFGFIIGFIIDNSVRESVREMVREVIHRSERKEEQSASQ